MKAKGIDILILMIYAYAAQQPEHDWYMQTDKDTFVSSENFLKNLTLPLGCCYHSFMQSQFVIELVTSLMFQNE